MNTEKPKKLRKIEKAITKGKDLRAIAENHQVDLEQVYEIAAGLEEVERKRAERPPAGPVTPWGTP